MGTAAPGANIAGVVIEELHIGNLSARVAFDRIVRRPLEQLYKTGFDEMILILVDALDETLTYSGETIVELLGHATDHPQDLPSPVRFLLTSRPDARVKHHIGQPSLDLIDNASANVDDVKAYAHRRLHELAEPKRSELAARIAMMGEGNFLYARYLLDDLAEDVEQIEDLNSLPLPNDLDDIYRQFLKRELARDLEQ